MTVSGCGWMPNHVYLIFPSPFFVEILTPIDQPLDKLEDLLPDEM
jgi:hypothetical protein